MALGDAERMQMYEVAMQQRMEPELAFPTRDLLQQTDLMDWPGNWTLMRTGRKRTLNLAFLQPAEGQADDELLEFRPRVIGVAYAWAHLFGDYNSVPDYMFLIMPGVTRHGAPPCIMVRVNIGCWLEKHPEGMMAQRIPS